MRGGLLAFGPPAGPPVSDSDSSPLAADAPLRRRPSQTRARRTVDTLLEAATRLLESEGEAGLTTNRIAERAGHSIGTLYQYFPGKEAIVVALVRRHRERVMRGHRALLEAVACGERAPEEAVRAYIASLLDAFGRGRRVLRRLAQLGRRLDAPALIVQTMDEGGARIAEALRRLDRPDLPAPSPMALHVLTRAVMGAIWVAVLEDDPRLEDPAFEDELVRLAWALLAPGRPLPPAASAPAPR